MAKAKILIVEDERIVAEDIRSSLLKMGYAVSAIASSGVRAISKAEELKPDLVLMDIVLEGEMNGIDAADRIRSRFNIPIVYLTAYADDKILERAKMTGPFGYIIKPFEDRELRSAIEMALYKYRVEEALRKEKEYYHSFVESLNEWVWEVDVNGILTYSNPTVEGLLGYTVKEVLGSYIAELWLEEDKTQKNYKWLKKTLSSGQGWKGYQGKFKHKNGSTVIMESTAIAIFDSENRLAGYRGIGRDITQRRRAEDELRESREQLRNLTAHVESVREEERTLVAREIHDELGQVLTALKMDLSWLSKKLSVEQETLLEKTKSMITLVDATIQTVKRISTELRPGLLDDLGLAAAIEWQAEEFQSRTGIRCTISIDPEDMGFDKERSTAMFRIFQETLTNVARHAQASKVRVLLREKHGVIELKVQDNGKGIAKRKPSDPNSYGIIGMRERAQFLGGKVEIRSVRGKGTTVLVTIPIRHKGGIQ